MKISKEAIKESTSNLTYTRGIQLHKENNVYGIREFQDDNILHVSAEVNRRYSASYHVSLEYDGEQETFQDFECDCPEFWQLNHKMCVHCVTVALEFAENKEENSKAALEQFLMAARKAAPGGRKSLKKAITSPELASLMYRCSMQDKAKFLQPEITGSIELEPTLHQRYRGWQVDFKIGASNKYVLKDLHGFLEAVKKREKVDYGKKLGFIHEMNAFTKHSQQLVAFLQKYEEEYKYYKLKSSYSVEYLPSLRALELSDEAMCEFLHLMTGRWCNIQDHYSTNRKVYILEGNPELPIKLKKLEGREGYELMLPPMMVFGGANTLYIRKGDMIYECDSEFSREMRSICELGEEKQITTLTIDEKDMNVFCTTIIPILERNTPIEVKEDLSMYLPEKAHIKIYLDNPVGFITAKLEAEYEGKVYNIMEDLTLFDVFRDTQRETAAAFTAQQYFEGISQYHELYLQETNEDAVYKLLTTGIEQLSQLGELYISETLKRMKIVAAPKVNIGVSITGDLLDLTIDSGLLSAEELSGFLENYRRRKKYFRLKNGDFMEIENQGIAAVSELVEGLHITERELEQGMVSIPRFRAFYVDQVLKTEGEGMEIHRDHSFKGMIRHMKSAEDSDFEVPQTLKKVLRNYQKTGFRWLCTLELMGFGGILADDMGLGKTLQMISFLLYKKQMTETKMTNLIICPASLVYNWQNEIEKFAPELSTMVLVGTQAERQNLMKCYSEYDVVITSYDLLRRDIESYKEMSFYTQIIDEAQYIKNHSTLVSKAVKKIKAVAKFALTGTPIENRLSELWSIFDYLMPGFLGNYKAFKTNYETVIMSTKDDIIIKRLQKMIKPFILRRIKSDVLKELPEKEENIIYSRLEGEQLALYNANVQRMLAKVAGQSNAEFNQGKLQILAELTRLRQICCAPSMVYENYNKESAKLDTCMELLRNAVEGGHKVLLFSQFTSLFSLIENELKKENVEYYKLTGATSKEQRSEMAAKFNEDEVPVFLISLKAGGTGLNLTGASIVIHFDPWWNVAAQNQATDRAHRIGQKNTVSVFKLIAKNTIEEKILKMQEAKKDLSDQIITGEGVSVSELTKEDFLGILEG
jgi:hypothetical protein